MRIAAALLESYERQVQSVEGALKVITASAFQMPIQSVAIDAQTIMTHAFAFSQCCIVMHHKTCMCLFYFVKFVV